MAAACHAGWNAMIKVGTAPFTMMTLVASGAGMVALPPLLIFGLPSLRAWPWLAASSLAANLPDVLSVDLRPSRVTTSRATTSARKTSGHLVSFAALYRDKRAYRVSRRFRSASSHAVSA